MGINLRLFPICSNPIRPPPEEPDDPEEAPTSWQLPRNVGIDSGRFTAVVADQCLYVSQVRSRVRALLGRGSSKCVAKLCRSVCTVE